MRRIRPEASAVPRGVTLIEMVVALVVLAIAGALIAYFIYPVRQAVDVAARAELTDVADNALQRMTREARVALPNSVRVTAAGAAQYLEFIPVVAGGRYRAEGGGPAGGTACPATSPLGQPDSDQLSFDLSDGCFKSLGPVYNAAAVAPSDILVLNNYGPGFAGQNAYEAAGTNRRVITAAAVEATPPRLRLQFTAGVFTAALHDSPARRFYVVRGNGAAPLPVTFECNGGFLRRWTGYAIVEAPQPTAFPGGTSTLLATGVTGCTFTYDPNTAPQAGLLTLQLTLSRARSGGGTETVALYHSVHIANIP